ncbi:MAG: T9SS type A sorting domain-containing protein [Chitinophagales bacterium]|nr:T9SS type A sorting domain-containing protein [Chitinophagales bacterium]MDW8273102.1 T9SS type A sorting domain-containing protein [Chitinophagales bacterium]
MKRNLFAFVALLFAKIGMAQVPNSGFENWKIDTSILNIPQPIVLIDTFSFEDPTGWTSVNYVTGADTFSPAPGGVILVTKSNNAFSGNFAAQIVTDNILVPLINISTPVPGFVISGEFKISLANLVGSNDFSPASIPGSGIPISGRLDSFVVHANYFPATGDSATLFAVLRKGNDIVASAVRFINSATNGYKRFAIPFVYNSCDVPDSITIGLSSSNLFELENIIGSLGSSNIPTGSRLLADEVSFSVAPNNYVVNPIARQDDTITTKNKPITVNVLANDQDCNPNATLSLGNISTTTAHGSAVKSGNNITYTPINNYVGFDTVFYQLVSSTGKSSNGILRIRVTDPSSVQEFDMVNIKVFPNPASNILNVYADLQDGEMVVFDLSGRKLVETEFNKQATVNVGTLRPGAYIIQLVSKQNAIVGARRFFVAK